MSVSDRRATANKIQPPLAASNRNQVADKSGRTISDRVRSVSALLLDLDEKRLHETLQSMLSQPAAEKAVYAENQFSETYELQNGNVNFTEAYRHIGGLIDALSGDPQLLNKTGVDDLLYRLTALLMNPDIFSGSRENKPITSVVSLDRLCRYILTNMSKRITMNELELISGCSSRTLQYQFKNQFGCSPMRWVANQRLDACRQRLINRQSHDTVTSIAIAQGFTNLGNFARLYAARFGELPSETLNLHRQPSIDA